MAPLNLAHPASSHVQTGASPAAGTRRPRWHPDDLPWSTLDAAAVRDNEPLFYLLVSASFIESGSDLYTRNLVDTYADADPGLRDWLQRDWEPEENQHGSALRAYVERVWPEFDWPGAFTRFFDEYGRSCRPDALEPTLTRELAARCVVETGTTAYYRALAAAAPEPVLRQLATLIAADELRHYKYFLAHFRARAQAPDGRRTRHQRASRWALLAVLGRRVAELRNDDGDCAIRHVWAARHPHGAAGPHDAIPAVSRRVNRLLRQHLPADLLARMLLRPLGLPRALRQRIEMPLIRLLTFALLRG